MVSYSRILLIDVSFPVLDDHHPLCYICQIFFGTAGYFYPAIRFSLFAGQLTIIPASGWLQLSVPYFDGCISVWDGFGGIQYKAGMEQESISFGPSIVGGTKVFITGLKAAHVSSDVDLG